MTLSLSKDYRKLSGDRVVAECEIYRDTDRAAEIEKSHLTKHLVFNLRGGCVYIRQFINQQYLNTLFPSGDRGVFPTITLFPEASDPIRLQNLNVGYLGLKQGKDALGIVFRFIDLTPKHLDQLTEAQSLFPALTKREKSIRFAELALRFNHMKTAMERPIFPSV